MKPYRIFLIRHGESVGNADKRSYEKMPDYAMPLTEKGWAQAREAGKLLRAKIKEATYKKDIAFYISPFHRARQTYQGLTESLEDYNCITKVEPRLREHEWGSRLYPEGAKWTSEDERDAYGKFYYRFEGGESGADVDLRLCSFLETVHRHFSNNDFPPVACFVMHGESIRLLIRRWFNLSIEEYDLMKSVPNCEIITLKLNLDTGKYVLEKPMEYHDSPTHPYQFEEANT